MKLFILSLLSGAALLATTMTAPPAQADKKDFQQIQFEKFTATPLASAPALTRQDFKGKVVLMDYWASWCEPCKEALPHYNSLFTKYKDKGLLVVGINEDDSEKERDAFLKKQKINFPLFADKDRKMAQVFRVTGLPALFVFDKQTKIVAVLHGFSPENAQTLEKKIMELLK